MWYLPGRSKREKEVVMTLQQLIRKVESIAMQQPSINMVVQNDVFRINSAPALKYGVFAWTQGQHSVEIATGMATYKLTLFYVDRLKADKSNMIEVQSVGCMTLSNILRTLEENDIEVEGVTLQPFNQRFTDECAGVFCSVSLTIPDASVCGESYVDLDEEFTIY
jgi:hypothetical protein